LLPAPAGSRTFPTLSLRILPNVPGPIPRRPPRCIHSFLPSGRRPSPILQRVGAPPCPGQPLQSRGSFRGCSHFVMFRPASLLATQVAPTPRPFQASGSRGFYFWAPHSSLPPRGPDRLAVRIEQLTAGRLALPKIRSLVGCTARPDPLPCRAGLRRFLRAG
jgi:hypothetical protein